MFGSKKSSKSAAACNSTLTWIVCIVFALSSLASLAGVYVTHMTRGGATFGSMSASLALIAFAVNFGILSKILWWMSCSNGSK